MQIIPINPDSDEHQRFVYDAVRKRAYDWPYTGADTYWLVESVRRCLVSNPRGCLLAKSPDDFYGYVLSDGPQSLVFAYTKYALRGPGAFAAPIGTPHAHEPVCGSLCSAVGVDLSLPTSVRIWSRAASKIAARGYPIYPLPID
jgi:hypothetical protein